MSADAEPQVRSSAWVAEAEAALVLVNKALATTSRTQEWGANNALVNAHWALRAALTAKPRPSATDKLSHAAVNVAEGTK